MNGFLMHHNGDAAIGFLEQPSQASSQGITIISLGSSCQPAHQIRRYCKIKKEVSPNLQQEEISFPFDWLVITASTVIKAIEDDFRDFLKPENLEYGYNTYPYITDKLYGVYYYHFFPMNKSFMEKYDSVSEKFRKTISNFRRTLTSGKKIVFVWQVVSQESSEVLKLKDTISTAYPNLDFGIIALAEDYEERIEDNIVYRKVSMNPNNWEGYDEPWTEALDFHDKFF